MSRRLAGLAIGCALACAALLAPAVASAATFSDGFAARESFKSFGKVTGSNVGATREAGEPALKPLAPASHTVWVEWEAPSSGYVTLSTCDSGIGTVLAAYVGTAVSALTEVDSVAYHGLSGCSGVRDGITFLAAAGEKFQIVLDGNSFFVPPAPSPPTEGPLSLQIEATPPPANDDFVAATPIVGRTTVEPGGPRFYFASEFGYNWGADKEAGEPQHAGDPGGASVWYSWTAPETGLAQVGICCGPLSLGVYLGDTVAALTEVKASAFGTIPVLAGTTYRVAVDGKYELVAGAARVSNFNLTVSMQLPPAAPLPPTDPDPASAVSAAPSPVTAPAKPGAVAPQTFLDSRKVRSAAGTATFTFHAGKNGSGFRCQLDARKAASCRAPKSYAGLAPGRHTFKVYAVDASGNADPTPATASFSIVRRQGRHG